jgi:hypothetical protein
MGQTQTTKYVPKDRTPKFNENLFFQFTDLKVWQLEGGMINIKLLDHSSFGRDQVLGTFTVDISYIYKLDESHEVYRVWVPLTDSHDED